MRILLVSQDGLYPETVGGMEIWGRQLADLWQRTSEVGVLTMRGLAAPDSSAQVVALPSKPFLDPMEPFFWPGARNLGWIRARPKRPVRRVVRRLVHEAKTRWWKLDSRRGIRRILSDFGPDLVYLNKFYGIDPLMLIEFLNWKGPIIMQFGGRTSEWVAPVVNNIWRHSKRRGFGGRLFPDVAARLMLVSNCEFVRTHYMPLFECEIPHLVIYQGIDTMAFYPRPSLLAGNHWAFLGRATREKGFVEFCRAMAALPRSLIGTIHILGNGTALDEGLEILRRNDRLDLITYVGAVPHEELPDRLREASILVHPSKDEGLPISVLEAMASGLAVIASDVGGTSEAVRDGETGLLVPCDDFARLVPACLRLAEDADVRRRLGSGARDFVLSRHTYSHCVNAMEKLIETAISRYRTAMPHERGVALA